MFHAQKSRAISQYFQSINQGTYKTGLKLTTLDFPSLYLWWNYNQHIELLLISTEQAWTLFVLSDSWRAKDLCQAPNYKVDIYFYGDI